MPFDIVGVTDAARVHITSLTHLFEATAARQPTAEAVIASDGTLSYASLRSRAVALASALRERGVTPGMPVPLVVGRSKHVAVGIVGILRSGAAYVPIDASYPAHRIVELIGECGATVCVTDGSSDSVTAVPSIRLSDELDEAAAPAHAVSDVGPDAPAVIVYTSGSTGRPKGVVLSHRAVLHRIAHGYPRRPNDLQRASISVVAHVSDLLVPLLEGGPVIVVDDAARRSIARLADYVERYRPSRLVFVPSLLRTLLDVGPEGERCLAGIDTVVLSGESLTPPVAAAFLSRFPAIRLVNAFGIAEAAGLASTGEITSAEDIHAGYPVPGTIIRVMSDALVPCGPDEPGEICFGGPQLAIGYLNDPVLTAERFIVDPGDHERLYRTGDLGVITPAGTLKVIGRIGLQVKVRGFRVNLVEIESALEQHERVSRALVTTFGDEDTQLHALVTSRTAGCDADVLREFLSARVPSYMVPHRFSIVDDLPMLPTHKIDRVKGGLMASALRSAASVPTVQVFETPAEECLAKLWAEMLGVTSVSRSDDFFRLGGDSFAAMRMVAEAELLGFRFSAEAVFDGCSLSELASLANASE